MSRSATLHRARRTCEKESLFSRAYNNLTCARGATTTTTRIMNARARAPTRSAPATCAALIVRKVAVSPRHPVYRYEWVPGRVSPRPLPAGDLPGPGGAPSPVPRPSTGRARGQERRAVRPRPRRLRVAACDVAESSSYSRLGPRRARFFPRFPPISPGTFLEETSVSEGIALRDFGIFIGNSRGT